MRREQDTAIEGFMEQLIAHGSNGYGAGLRGIGRSGDADRARALILACSDAGGGRDAGQRRFYPGCRGRDAGVRYREPVLRPGQPCGTVAGCRTGSLAQSHPSSLSD